MFAHHTAPLKSPAKLNRIAKFAESANYRVEFRGTVYVRNWPQASSKPYHLAHADGSHIAAFATLEALEKNLRARIGE